MRGHPFRTRDANQKQHSTRGGMLACCLSAFNIESARRLCPRLVATRTSCVKDYISVVVVVAVMTTTAHLAGAMHFHCVQLSRPYRKVTAPRSPPTHNPTQSICKYALSTQHACGVRSHLVITLGTRHNDDNTIWQRCSHSTLCCLSVVLFFLRACSSQRLVCHFASLLRLRASEAAATPPHLTNTSSSSRCRPLIRSCLADNKTSEPACHPHNGRRRLAPVIG